MGYPGPIILAYRYAAEPGKVLTNSLSSNAPILVGIELMHMIAKGQLKTGGGPKRSVAEQFYALAM
jgi:hypothetical protein